MMCVAVYIREVVRQVLYNLCVWREGGGRGDIHRCLKTSRQRFIQT
jgi:hypothetical protein